VLKWISLACSDSSSSTVFEQNAGGAEGTHSSAAFWKAIAHANMLQYLAFAFCSVQDQQERGEPIGVWEKGYALQQPF
jgi:hypothetical protein